MFFKKMEGGLLQLREFTFTHTGKSHMSPSKFVQFPANFLPNILDSFNSFICDIIKILYYMRGPSKHWVQ